MNLNIFERMYPDLYPVEDHSEPPEYLWYHPGLYRAYCVIADRIEADPSLLRSVLSILDHWIEIDADQGGMRSRWKKMIQEALADPTSMKKLLAFLRSDSEQSRHYKKFSSFLHLLEPGELSRLKREADPDRKCYMV